MTVKQPNSRPAAGLNQTFFNTHSLLTCERFEMQSKTRGYRDVARYGPFCSKMKSQLSLVTSGCNEMRTAKRRKKVIQGDSIGQIEDLEAQAHAILVDGENILDTCAKIKHVVRGNSGGI